MNQDDDLSLDQKIKILQKDGKADLEFLHSINERCLGYPGKKNLFAAFSLQACAEDELVKKQFKEMRCEMPGLPRSTFLMVFSPDGSKVASTHGNHHIYVTDVRTGKHIKTLVGHPRTPWSIAFHPTSNQIIASGCLGGQVRIWDLSGGSEVWTAESQTVIASIAFHPEDRLLVIATSNQLLFWDWSKPEPFMHVSTSSAKEKVRYVAYDKLGHKLITGITNSPQTRWERVRAPVPVPRPVERSASPYRRRITPRLVTSCTAAPNVQCTSTPSTSREPLSSVPERERRITTCYRDLVQQYEVLVHRYLQIYRPPVMVDQGTDPMEVEDPAPSTSTSTISTSTTMSELSLPSTSSRPISPVPSTSGIQTMKKSSAAHPAKNKSRKYCMKSEGSSSSSTGMKNEPTTCPKTSMCSTQTQAPTSSDILASLSSSSSEVLRTDSFSSALHINDTEFRVIPPEETEMRSSDNLTNESRPCDEFRVNIPAASNGNTGSKESFMHRMMRCYKNIVVRNTNEESSSSVTPQSNDNHQDATEPAICKYLHFNRPRRGDPKVMRERLSSNVTRLTILVPMSSTATPTTQTNTPTRSNSRKLLLTPQNIPPTTTAAASVSSNNNTNNLEPFYRMRIKCSVTPKPSETTESAQPNIEIPETNNSTQTSDNISDLLRNAELMLAKFRENLEQSGHVHGADLPSTSRLFIKNPSNKNKPSKGTSTNDGNTDNICTKENVRKRVYYGFLKKHNRRMLVNSSSDSSSDDNDEDDDDDDDDERKTSKRIRISERTDSDTNYNNRASSTAAGSSDHSYAGNSTPNEHSYAGLTESNNADNNTVRIKINLSSLTTDEENHRPPAEATRPQSVTNNNERPINFNAELELLVTDLLADAAAAAPPATTEAPPLTRETNSESVRICNTCGGSIDERNRRDNNNTEITTTAPITSCTRTNTCTRPTLGSNTRTTNSTTLTSSTSEMPRRRFLSHRLSAFHPTRLSQSRIRSSRSPSSLQPLLRSRLGNLNSNDSPTRSPNSAPDEVVNYAERVNEEENSRAFHPFDPPPDLMSINPENIGIGSMYSNIVQELESSLNDVRSIRANRRLGETSDMLSSFSERLESIMTQSNVILRNLSTSLDSLPPNENEASSTTVGGGGGGGSQQRVYRPLRTLDQILTLRNVFANNSNPITSDHTYPLNPENPQASNMIPLMVSLHLTVSHIQRQARLLRQQVESIERIDRAMLEVAQLQMIRQMFDELHRHFSSITGNDGRIGVSSVRQMMAGTRISDSTSPLDSPSDDNVVVQHPPPPAAPEPEPQASTSQQQTERQLPTSTRAARARKLYPRCLFLMHRQFRRANNMGLGSRRTASAALKEKALRRNIYRRFLPSRTNNRPNIDLSSSRGRGYLNLSHPDTLPSMTRRLEHFLMEHGRYIGRSIIPTSTTGSDVGEHIMMLRLNNCRQRINRILGVNEATNMNNEFSSVTIDGSSRFGARQTLSSILDTLSSFMAINSHIPSHVRPHIWEVIELSLLLSEILLLQIVDSIPPPSGMNLDPERESLSVRIDQMCSRMLQSRLSGQSQQLTRSLRLLRLTVRHATQALGQTYTARRNAMLPSNNNNDGGGSERLDSRQGLLDDIHNCLRNIRRHREYSSSSRRVDNVSISAGRAWYSTIHDLITRYINTSQENNSNSNGNSSMFNNNNNNNETGEETIVEDAANSSDDNTNNNSTLREIVSRPLYRTSNVNLLHNAETNNPSGSSRMMWNVPTVQVNDVPVSEPQHSPWHPRFVANRQRLSERLDELRTIGGLFRPRFLHPFYAGVNPFEAGDLDEAHREQLYDGDIIPTVVPNHRIQVWEVSQGNVVPNISNAIKNVVVNECKIHNDASVDYASDGSILVTLLPSGGYMNVTNRLGVYSLEWESLGQCLYITSFEQNAVSVSLSPLNRHLVVGLASRRVSIMPSDKWTMARIFLLDDKEAPYGKLSPIRELEQNRDSSYMSLNCIRWLPSSGQGLVFATNPGHLRFLT